MREVLSEAGEIVMPIRKGILKKEDIHGEFAEVIAGKKRGRTFTENITLFTAIGFDVEDAVIADPVCNKAVERGLGRFMEIKKEARNGRNGT
jgi:ornithine cyclodeaminase/alanine dehydrogenase-like protein (mu-crystallin family)